MSHLRDSPARRRRSLFSWRLIDLDFHLAAVGAACFSSVLEPLRPVSACSCPNLGGGGCHSGSQQIIRQEFIFNVLSAPVSKVPETCEKVTEATRTRLMWNQEVLDICSDGQMRSKAAPRGWARGRKATAQTCGGFTSCRYC